MKPLAPGDFDAYFKAVHGVTPFPWQRRLLEKVAVEGRWPSLLDLPTGTGKTAAIDVAVFHLALEAARPAAERRAPRRIVMVVDRRTVVDQAFERARKIAQKLERAIADAEDGVLRVVAEHLRAYTGGAAPLALAQLRGGMPRDDAWAERPDQPVVAVSTVDQVGSRLLFRGYGVSPAMRPIHAGLLGNDVLLLLDEVHLSVPFQQTLGAVARYRTWTGSAGDAASGGAVLPERWQFVQMSATPGSAGDFGLDAKDREDAVLARRLAASKPVESGHDPVRRGSFAEVCATRAAALAKTGRVVGVVVNRVATARDVAARLRSDASLPVDKRVFLVTGRMRPLDRAALDAELGPLVRSGRERPADAAPVIVVSTQCIEAGADFDFDALVTECASLDALRQRFGRLNRLGDIDDARGVVLAQHESVAKGEPDPIYGEALARTWEWLREAERDLGIERIEPAIEELKKPLEGGEEDGDGGGGGAGTRLDGLLSPKERAPVMLPAHLDMWVQTKPAPVPDPDVSLWLHGVGREQRPEVQIVWRGDLTERLLDLAATNGGVEETLRQRVEEALRERLAACPPLGLEALSVPIDAARAWLMSEEAPELADVEGRTLETRDDTRRTRQTRTGRPAFLWRGEEGRVIRAKDLAPEQVLVVPCEYGGLAPSGGADAAGCVRGGSWDPSNKERVADLAEQARWEQTRKPIVRLHPSLVSEPAWAKTPSPAEGEAPDEEDREAVEAVLDEMRTAARSRAGGVAGGTWELHALEGLEARGRRGRVIVRLDDIVTRDERGDGYVIERGYLAVVARFPVKGARSAEGGGDATTEEDAGSHTGVEVSLREHLRGVASWARGFADACGLPERIARSVEVAAAWHDAGKVDPRFQRMLRGGAESRAAVSEPIAKSKIVLADRAAQRRAAERSGYPRGTRHELASVALLSGNLDRLGPDVDTDLVLHLIASHHGHCRPFAPVASEDESGPVDLVFAPEGGGGEVRARSDHGLWRLDSGVAERFWVLVERYGWFGLAWLEAMVRLADHRRSEEEQQRRADAVAEVKR